MGAKRCVGSLGISKRSTSAWRKWLRPAVQPRPLFTSGASAPTQPRISCERREMQMARLPVQ